MNSTRIGFLGLAATALCAVLLGACQKGDSPKCKPTQDALRAAINSQDFAKARDLRTPLYAECGDPEALAELDRKLVTTERGVANQQSVAETRKRRAFEFTRIFLDFVAQHRAAPERASVYHRCDKLTQDAGLADAQAVAQGAGPVGSVVPVAAAAPMKPAEDAEAADAESGDAGSAEEPSRFCTASRKVGKRQLIQVRYWEGDPRAFRFTMAPETPMTCAAVGGKVLKSWDVPVPGEASVKRWQCELDGPLKGLLAIVSDSLSASVHVISPSYLERDIESRPIFDGS